MVSGFQALIFFLSGQLFLTTADSRRGRCIGPGNKEWGHRRAVSRLLQQKSRIGELEFHPQSDGVQKGKCARRSSPALYGRPTSNSAAVHARTRHACLAKLAQPINMTTSWFGTEPERVDSSLLIYCTASSRPNPSASTYQKAELPDSSHVICTRSVVKYGAFCCQCLFPPSTRHRQA